MEGTRGGTVIDNSGEEEVDMGGDNASLEKIEEPDETVIEQGGETDPNRGTENPEDGENAGTVEDTGSEEGQEPGPAVDPRLDNVEKLLKDVTAKLDQKPAEPIKERTAEEWAALEQEWGAPRSTIERVTKQSVQVYNKIMDTIEARFAKYEIGESIDSLAKEQGFNDATRYKKDVTAYLSRYEPKFWAHPQLLKDAVIYARGLNANANVTRARNDSERNRVIAGKARPSAPGGGQRRQAMPALTPAQREAASLMGSEAEYRKYSGGRKTLE